jgi:hypothetical protein
VQNHYGEFLERAVDPVLKIAGKESVRRHRSCA